MKVFYHSALITKELKQDSVFRTIPGRAYIEIEKERGEQDFEILLNGDILDANTERIEIEAEAELIIRTKGGEKSSYLVKPIVRELSNQYALVYEQFMYEYWDKPDNEIESIKAGLLKMYAVDQNANIFDWTETFNKIESAFKAFKAICEKPNSHLKAVNEIRPIETVKRIGYESIPYLASHSEDWLARTASGLKPARLFSRVENDEYQIYENRVVKTLIDLIVSFLRKKEKELKDQYEQLHGIMNSSVQIGSFGFDVSFQKAVAELVTTKGNNDDYRSKALELADKLNKRSKQLLKKYRTLKSSKLYRYLKKAKPAINPLNETNILLMDRHYNVIFVLWKEIHQLVTPKQLTKQKKLELKYTCNDYLFFCKVLCGYTAHVLNFNIIEDGLYLRSEDNLELTIVEENGLINLVIIDRSRRTLTVSNDLIPIAPGANYGSFSYDGNQLSWASTVSVDEIEKFCSLFKTRERRAREQAEAHKKYRAIKQAIDQRQREYSTPRQTKAVICPVVVEIEKDTRNTFKDYAISCAIEIANKNCADYVIIALPLCNEDEQKIIEYAKYVNEKALILPLTMFDINSFRRLQNVFLRMILSFGTGHCPACGKKIEREYDNQCACGNCHNLILTTTICPNSSCKETYNYLSYDTSEDTIAKMQQVDKDNFYLIDSLYQYKDVVPMNIQSGRLKTICPYCHR